MPKGSKNHHSAYAGRSVYIVDGCRTPFLKARGRPGPFSASDLAVQAGRSLLLRQPFAATDIDEVITGCIIPSPDEANIGRLIALRLGCGHKVPGWTVQRNCASGMQSIDSAAKDIASGRADLVLAGGTEAMSHAPLLFKPEMVNWLADFYGRRGLKQTLKVISQFRLQYLAPVISLLRGLNDPLIELSMGKTAEILAERFNISRLEMDEYSVTSHQRVAQAQEKGELEVVPIYDQKGRVYDRDDGVRPDSSVEKLATLKPFFDKKFGKVTAGNSSQVTDGAVMLMLASEDAVKQYDLPVLGCIKDVEWAALDPAQMGLGPAHAVPPLLQRQGLTFKDIDYWEMNEAFATQVLACFAAWKDADYCRNELGLDGPLGDIDPARFNVNGGAVALGHPVGASGARIVLHLLEVMRRQGAKRGVASICIGGGQGGAMLLEAPE